MFEDQKTSTPFSHLHPSYFFFKKEKRKKESKQESKQANARGVLFVIAMKHTMISTVEVLVEGAYLAG